MNNQIFRVLFAGIVCLTGCGKHHRATNDRVAADQGAGTANFDACALLTNADVEAVQKSNITSTKKSGNAGQDLQTWQCFYSAAEFSRSVVISVTKGARLPGRGPLAYWEQTFSREREEKEHGGESEADKEKRQSLGKHHGEEEEAAPARSIAGIGDEAFWSGNRVGGALYVLSKKKNAFVRISVGGSDTEEAKIEKSKELALKALEHL
jgi:hypothetical protein